MAEAVINVRVKGQEKLERLQKTIERTSKKVEAINQSGVFEKAPATLNRVNRLLQQAQQNVNNAAAGTKLQQVAIRQVVKLKQEQLKQEQQISRELGKQQFLQSKIGKFAKNILGEKRGGQLGGLVGRLSGRAGKGLGRVIGGGLTGGLFPLLMGGGLAEGVGGGIGGALGALIGGPAGGLAGSLAGQFLGEKLLGGEGGLFKKLGIGEAAKEAEKLTNETQKLKDLTEGIARAQARNLSFSMQATAERRKGNELLAIELERRAERNKIAQDQFKQSVELDKHERNKTEEGRKYTRVLQRQLEVDTQRLIKATEQEALDKAKDAILKMQLDKANHLARMEQKRVDIQKGFQSAGFKVESASLSAALQINALEMQRAKNNKDIARQFELQVQRANLVYRQTLLQVQQEVNRVKLARTSAQIELNRLRIELNKTKEAGKDTTLQKQSIELQKQSLVLANLNVKAAEQAAKFQIRGAEAVRTATIEQARYTRTQQVSTNNIRPFAEGGYVTRPTSALIGEAGESEYVIPASKMNRAMQRYSAGVRGEAVTAGAVGAGSTTNANYSSQQNMYYGGGGTSVNITTGPVIRMNNRDYVAMSDLQRGMSTAVGAAESNMMGRMSRSYSTRRSMGL